MASEKILKKCKIGTYFTVNGVCYIFWVRKVNNNNNKKDLKYKNTQHTQMHLFSHIFI